ncbi:MAG: LysR family transcriptional regulator [Sphingomonas sp.]
MSVHPLYLNLRHLRAVAAIADHGSISLAARAENLSQPALTQGVAKLEQRLGVALFERRADGVSATEAGQELASRVAAAFEQLSAATRAILRGGGRGFTRPERLMTSAQIRGFLALADHGSFVAAATATGVSQPALHRAVRDLEGICGIALAVRRGQGVALTDEGRRLARGARLAVAEIAAGMADLVPDAAGGARIVIGAMPLCRAFVLPHAIAAFAREGLPAEIDVREGSWRELAEPLRDGTIDMMIGALRPEAPAGLEQRALFKGQLAIIGRDGHPLAGVPDPTPAMLARYGWIVGAIGTPLRTQWETLFTGVARPAAPIECGSVMVIRGVLRDSDLLTLLSPDQVALEIESKVLATIGRPVTQGVRTIGVTTRLGWRPTVSQRRFLDLLDVAATHIGIPEKQ